MKVFLVFVCLAGLAATDPQDDVVQRTKEDLVPIEQLFNKLVALLKKYDPVHIESKTIFDILGMYLRVKHLHAEGFSNIISDYAVDVVYPETKVKFEWSLPDISASVESFDVSTPIIFGQGSASLSLKNGTGSISIVYNFEDGLKPTVVVASVESVNVAIIGLNNNTELGKTISKTTSNFLYDVINSSAIHNRIGNLIDTVINFFIGKM